MDSNGSMHSITGPSPTQAWLANLAGGLRLAFFRRPGSFQFHVSANHFIAIAASSLAVSYICSFALAGFGGTFNLRALPSELLWLPLALFAGYLIGRVKNDERYVLLIPIALGAISIPLCIASSVIWFAAEFGWLQCGEL